MSGDLDAAEQAYRKILAERPADAAAEAGLAQVGLVRRVAGVDPRRRARPPPQATPTTSPPSCLAADVEVLSGQAEQAYARLVGLVRRTAGDERETVRQHLVVAVHRRRPGRPGGRLGRGPWPARCSES